MESVNVDMSGLHLPVALIIMDGFGLAEPGPGNAISLAHTPCLDRLFATCPNTSLLASGVAVGLPEGQMGNSEVGHLNIGAGRVVYQELTRINRACADGSLATNATIMAALDKAKVEGSVLHLMGLLSDGGVHSSNEHLYALMETAAARGVRHVHIHCFTDGRDVPPASGIGYIEQLQRHIDQVVAKYHTCDIHIASISGRYYAMDRDNRWDRVQKTYEAIAGCMPKSSIGPTAFMQQSYENGVTDEFVVPASFTTRGMENHDVVVFFNFRPDRARQITRAFTERDFTYFERIPAVHPHFVCLTEYDPTIDAAVAFPKEFPDQVLADVLADAGLAQYHIAETEKYAHVTFFLNGGREQEKPGERRTLVPSPKIATYDLQPQMSEPQVAHTLVAAIDAGEADVYIVNFANCDMVGHTGSIPAAVAAVEAVDTGVAQVLAAIERKGGLALVTADHGNADKMVADDGGLFTAHTTNPVPLVLVDDAGLGYTLEGKASQGVAALSNIAPTLLDMIGLKIPAQMTSPSLLVRTHLS